MRCKFAFCLSGPFVYYSTLTNCRFKPGLHIIVTIAEHACDDASKRFLKLSGIGHKVQGGGPAGIGGGSLIFQLMKRGERPKYWSCL